MAAPAQEPPRGLHVVGGSGEIVEHRETAKLLAEIEQLRVDRKMLKRDIVTKNRKISELERNRVNERLQYERRADVERIATYWHRRCRAEDYARPVPKVNPMSPDRFDAVRGLLDQEQIIVDADTGRRRREPMYSLDQFKLAIDGAHFDAFETKRKNGSLQRHDDLELITRSSKHFEEFIAKAPVAPAPKVAPQLPESFVTDWAR